MRTLMFALALSLFVVSNVTPLVAQTGETVAAPSPAKSPSRGFDWFFANVKRPDVPCVGEIVVATWYASGHRTANGEKFDPNGLTAAHRTLPFGSRVTVTDPRSGKSITVTINDRGPFTKGVTLDLARGAARALGMTQTQWVCMAAGSEFPKRVENAR